MRVCVCVCVCVCVHVCVLFVRVYASVCREGGKRGTKQIKSGKHY